MIFARALLEQSLQVAAETYGAASLLVGGSSDEGECEDIAVVVESKQMGEAEWETIVEQLGLQSGKVSCGYLLLPTPDGVRRTDSDAVPSFSSQNPAQSPSM